MRERSRYSRVGPSAANWFISFRRDNIIVAVYTSIKAIVFNFYSFPAVPACSNLIKFGPVSSAMLFV